MTSLTAVSRASLLFNPSPRERIKAAKWAQALSNSVKRSVSSATLAFAVALARSLKTQLGSGRDNSLLISVRAGKEVPSLINCEIFCLMVFASLLAAAMVASSPSGMVRFSGFPMTSEALNGMEGDP